MSRETLATRETLPELAGRRVRFLSLYVLFDENVAIVAAILPQPCQNPSDPAATKAERLQPKRSDCNQTLEQEHAQQLLAENVFRRIAIGELVPHGVEA